MQHLLQGRGSSFLSAGLIVLLCWLLAQWTWLVFSPKSNRAPHSEAFLSAQTAADAIIVRHLFGGGVSEEDSPPERPVTSSNLKLRGVFAAIGALPAFAILSVDGKVDQPVKAGTVIAPGLVLEAVYPDYVEVRRQGVAERLELEKKTSAPSSVSNSPDFRLNVQSRGPGNYGFSKNELNQALQDPNQFANLGRFSSQPGQAGMAVVYAPHGSLANKMGLQQGDVVLRVNGQPVNSNGDVSRIYQQLQQMRQVRLEGLRSGKSLLLNYMIQ